MADCRVLSRSLDGCVWLLRTTLRPEEKPFGRTQSSRDQNCSQLDWMFCELSDTDGF